MGHGHELMDSVGRQEIATLMTGSGGVNSNEGLKSLAFAPDESMIAIGREDGSIDIWKTVTDEEVNIQRRGFKPANSN